MKFEDYRIAPEIKESLQELEYKRPTDIQYKAIPPILRGEDVLAIAQTGTGKTAAYAIPIIHLIDQKQKAGAERLLTCVVMVPTRELAIQVEGVIKKLAAHTKVYALAVFGGVDQEPQIEKLKKGVNIVIATPGRLFDLTSQGYLKLKAVKVVVLDEADHMLDMGFIEDIENLVRFIPTDHQTLFFSATIDKKIKKIAYSLVTNAIRIQISPRDPVARNIEHAVAMVEMDDKRFFLERFINENPLKKILVFVRTKVRAERVQKAMKRVDIETEVIHGGKEQADRISVLDKFREGTVKIMIATDVSARGIDIPNVDYVINYDLPEQSENYVHRVGRTGRASHKGQAISFCSSDEKKTLEEIEAFLDKRVNRLEVSKNDYLETIEISNESHEDWKTLIKENEEFQKKKKKKKKKK